MAKTGQLLSAPAGWYVANYPQPSPGQNHQDFLNAIVWHAVIGWKILGPEVFPLTMPTIGTSRFVFMAPDGRILTPGGYWPRPDAFARFMTKPQQ